MSEPTCEVLEHAWSVVIEVIDKEDKKDWLFAIIYRFGARKNVHPVTCHQ